MMMTSKRFKWSDDYKVGVELFDQQHKHFFEITNEIYDLLESGNVDRETLLTVADKMSSYVHYHLFSEDEAFRMYHYPELEVHIKAHEDYTKRIKGYMDVLTDTEAETDYQEVAKELLDFASQWLADHIIVMDKRYSKYLKGKKIE